MSPIRAAFVMEQTLGHVTHYRNLREVVAGQSGVVPTWLPIPFDVGVPDRFVPLLRSNWSARASWRARRALNAALSARPHDAVVFHTQVPSLFSFKIARRLPTLVSLDATPLNYDTVGRYYGHEAAGDGPLDRLKYHLSRRIFQAAAGLVTWSEWARRSLIDDYGVDPDGIRVLAPGAAPAYFELGRGRTNTVPSATVERRIKLLFVGGDFQRKGGPVLLDSLHGELADRCEVHLVTQAQVAPKPNVHVHKGLGPNSPELLRLFAEADVFVLPTRAECLAVVLMEATAAGLPVITTDVGALAEGVRPGDTGLLVQPGDVRDLHQALQALTRDGLLRQRLGRAGYDLARQKFDARRNNGALLEFVAEIARPGGMRRAA
jgi:glycosyltransferase involved in cell wall biosynthesis